MGKNRDRKKQGAPPEPPDNASNWPASLAEWLERASLALALAAVCIATLRIAATYPVFNHTIDEPAHIACGMEWLEKGTYNLEPQHPPLARIFSALGPFLSGIGSQGFSEIYREGGEILYAGGSYQRTLTLARLGTLPFFWLACGVLYFGATRWFGKAVGGLSVFCFTLLPPILAHASLATTDMALTATVALAFLAILLWGEQPSLPRAAMMGFAVALAVTSKFSSLAFLPAMVGLTMAWLVISKRSLNPLSQLLSVRGIASAGVALVVCAIAVWAIYRFSFSNGIPASELIAGIREAHRHQTGGHPSYLLGSRSNSGFWLFYPVALAVKTPLGLLLLALSGFYFAAKQRAKVQWIVPVAAVLGILAVGFYSRINIGTRHVLPIYFFLSILGAAAALECFRIPRRTFLASAAILLISWAAISGAWNHPDYIAYFNELAGDQPEEILADSDLDWGQDMLRLSARLRELNTPLVTFSPFIAAELEAVHGFPRIRLSNPEQPSDGWNAVSITVWKVARLGLNNSKPKAILWPDVLKPTERVGRSVLLYYVPPRRVQGAPPESDTAEPRRFGRSRLVPPRSTPAANGASALQSMSLRSVVRLPPAVGTMAYMSASAPPEL